MISNSVKVNLSLLSKKAKDDQLLKEELAPLVTGTPLLAAVKFFLFDARLFQLFASITFPTWERMQVVMIAFFGNTANDNYSTNALTVAQLLSKWFEQNQQRQKYMNVTADASVVRNPYCSFSEVPITKMTQRFSDFVGNDNNGISHRLSEWGILCLLKTSGVGELLQESLVLNDLFHDFGDLPQQVHELLCKRSEAKGDDKTDLLNDARSLLPQVRHVMSNLEDNLKRVFLYSFEHNAAERTITVHSTDVLYEQDRYGLNAMSFVKFKYLKNFGFFPQQVKENDRDIFDRTEDVCSAINDSSKYVPMSGDALQFLCKISVKKLVAIHIFVEYSRYYFDLLDKRMNIETMIATKKTVIQDKSSDKSLKTVLKQDIKSLKNDLKALEKTDDAKFLERWSRFAFGSLNSKFLANVPFSPKLSNLFNKFSLFEFGHTMRLKTSYDSPARMFYEMNYCVSLSKLLLPLIGLHKGKIKFETLTDLDFAHLSCPSDLKHASKDLRFQSHDSFLRFQLAYNRKELPLLKMFWDVVVECQIFRSLTLAGTNVYLNNILTMMKNAKLVKDDALSKKEQLVSKKQKTRSKSNQVTITARPKSRLIDGVSHPVTISLNIDGVQKELPMAGFKMVFVSTPVLRDPLHGHVLIFRKFELDKKDGDSKKWSSVLFGVINNNGKFLHTTAVKKYLSVPNGHSWINGYGDLLTLLRVLNAFPSDCSSVLAKMTGSCLACGLPMTHDESLKSGFGAVCMKNFGLTKDGVKSLLPSGVYQINKDNKVISNAPSFEASESPSKKLKNNETF